MTYPQAQWQLTIVLTTSSKAQLIREHSSDSFQIPPFYLILLYCIFGISALIRLRQVDLWTRFLPFHSFSSVQSLSHVRLFATPWIAARQASLSITNSRSSLKLTFIESVMPSSHLILCRPLLLLPPIPPSIRVFSYESSLHMRWPKYWSFSFSIIPSKEIPGLISFRMDWIKNIFSFMSYHAFHNTVQNTSV